MFADLLGSVFNEPRQDLQAPRARAPPSLLRFPPPFSTSVKTPTARARSAHIQITHLIARTLTKPTPTMRPTLRLLQTAPHPHKPLIHFLGKRLPPSTFPFPPSLLHFAPFLNFTPSLSYPSTTNPPQQKNPTPPHTCTPPPPPPPCPTASPPTAPKRNNTGRSQGGNSHPPLRP